MTLEFSFTSTIQDSSYMAYMIVPPEIAQSFLDAGQKRVICAIDKNYVHSALTPVKGTGHIIMLGKNARKKLEVFAGSTYEITLLKDESEHQMEMPEVWLEVIESDHEAAEAFQKLTPGKKRSILHMVGSAKRMETQINRALKIAENIKMGVTNPRDFMKS
jgi:hypothetical protein